MKRIATVLGLLVAVAVSQRALADDYDGYDDQDREVQQNVQTNFDTFHDGLSPYGSWEYDSTYGQVFYPNVGYGWRPYTYGRWVMTDYGWTWVSEEPFGWATFHYGRWWWNPYRHAWGWVPGYEWAPAWVVWRYGDASVGWAPLYVGYDYWVDSYPVYYEHWVYVPCEHFYNTPVYTYAYSTQYVRTTYYSSTVVNGYVGTTNYGPPHAFVQQHSAVPIVSSPVVHGASPAGATNGRNYNGGALTIYRPATTSVYQPHIIQPPAVRGSGAAPVESSAYRGPYKSPNVVEGNNIFHPGGAPASMKPATQTTRPQHYEPVNTRPENEQVTRPTYHPQTEPTYHPQPAQQQPQFHQPAREPTQPTFHPQPQPPQQQQRPPQHFQPAPPPHQEKHR
jgi:hypothetical protein